ncbi:MAG: hypothetical protein KBA31_12640 [Alphaproteobacteria bacterium]|nr:hypothetical protein [Alphaproteobacteria bacterium]
MSPDKADELIALTTKLAVLIEQDIATLKGNRPSALAQNEGDRAVLLANYGKAVSAFKATPMTAVAADLKQRLKTATERLHKGMKEQQRLLTRFRHVTEGLVKAVAEAVTAREAPTAYAKTGTYAPPQGRASALTFNQAV